MHRYLRCLTILLFLFVIVLLAACGTTATEEATPVDDATITIGSKNFTEQVLVGEMYTLLLQDAGLPVEHDRNLGDTRLVHDLMIDGEIDLYPEYTGTALVVILDISPDEASNDATRVAEMVRTAYQEQFDLVWLDTAPMNNTYAFALPRMRAREYNVATISELLAMADELTLTGPPEFRERADGLKAVRRVYGDVAFAEYMVSATDQRYQYLISSDADVVVAFRTDGEIGAFDLLLLKDNKGAFPPAQLAPVVRQEVLDTHPEIARLLNALAPELTDTTLRRLNYEVSGKQRNPSDVAREFLVERDMLEEEREQ